MSPSIGMLIGKVQQGKSASNYSHIVLITLSQRQRHYSQLLVVIEVSLMKCIEGSGSRSNLLNFTGQVRFLSKCYKKFPFVEPTMSRRVYILIGIVLVSIIITQVLTNWQ